VDPACRERLQGLRLNRVTVAVLLTTDH